MGSYWAIYLTGLLSIQPKVGIAATMEQLITELSRLNSASHEESALPQVEALNANSSIRNTYGTICERWKICNISIPRVYRVVHE